MPLSERRAELRPALSSVAAGGPALVLSSVALLAH
jgi:hypothetical protein